jgi:hypothetical protein
MKKRVLLLIGCFSLFSFFIGWMSGRSGLILVKAQSTLQPDVRSISLIEQNIADAVFVTSVLDYLESSRPEDAVQILHFRQGGDILTINSLLSSASEQSRRATDGLFRRIAKSHPVWKVEYRGNLPQLDTNATIEVEAILKNYR